MRRAPALALSGVVLLAGCAEGFRSGTDAGAPLTVALPSGADPSPGTDAEAPPEDAVTVEDFDTTSVAERTAAAADTGASGAETPLGSTIGSLGDPSLPGFWAETPLVDAVRQGKLTYPETGLSVQVELRPSKGAPGSGTRVSLPAMRVLQAPLTALPELRVSGL